MRAEKIFQEVRTIIFQNLMKTMSPRIQESQQIQAEEILRKLYQDSS